LRKTHFFSSVDSRIVTIASGRASGTALIANAVSILHGSGSEPATLQEAILSAATYVRNYAADR
jgi:hypothetical protein